MFNKKDKKLHNERRDIPLSLLRQMNPTAKPRYYIQPFPPLSKPVLVPTPHKKSPIYMTNIEADLTKGNRSLKVYGSVYEINKNRGQDAFFPISAFIAPFYQNTEKKYGRFDIMNKVPDEEYRGRELYGKFISDSVIKEALARANHDYSKVPVPRTPANTITAVGGGPYDYAVPPQQNYNRKQPVQIQPVPNSSEMDLPPYPYPRSKNVNPGVATIPGGPIIPLKNIKKPTPFIRIPEGFQPKTSDVGTNPMSTVMSRNQFTNTDRLYTNTGIQGPKYTDVKSAETQYVDPDRSILERIRTLPQTLGIIPQEPASYLARDVGTNPAPYGFNPNIY